MTIYTIAIETHECYGHGDYGTERRIVKTGGYGSGGFPPAFTTRAAAERWLKENGGTFCSKPVVVEIELVMPSAQHKFDLTGMAAGDSFLGCPNCWFRHDPGTAARRDCPVCGCGMKIYNVTPTDIAP